MGENMTSELFARRIPGRRMFAFYTQNGMEDSEIIGVQIACKSYLKAKLPKSITQAINSIKKKPYSMNENAERLAKALPKADRTHGNLEEMTRKAYIRNVEDLHALRSFAWTIGDYQKRIGTEYENLSEKELEAIAKAVIDCGYVNYRGGSYFPGLCSQPDMNVFYIPEGIDKETKKQIAEYGKTASLNRIRKDLNRLRPVVENVAMALFAGTVPEETRILFVKVLSAWCALAIAAKEPFFMTAGPKNYRGRKTAIKPVDVAADTSVEPEGSYLVAEIDGELVRIKTSEVDKEEMYRKLSESAIPTAVLADAKTILPKLSEFGEIDIQFISKRLTGIEEDSIVANNDSGRERTVEELIAELMGNSQKKEAEPAPAPTPVEPEWDVSTNSNSDIEPGWEVTPAKPVAPATPVAPQPAPVIPEPTYVAPEPVYVAPQPAPVIPEPTYVAPEPVYVAPQPAPVIPEPTYVAPEPVYVAPQPAPVIPEPTYVAPEPVYVAPQPAPVVPEPVAAPQPEPIAQPVEEPVNEEIDEHEAAVRKRMREILEQNKKKQQEKDDVRRQMEERRLEVARKQEQRRQEILAKRRADYENLLKEEEELKKVVEENKSALMGDRKRKRMEAEKRIFDIEDIIMKEYLDLKRGTNDYHTGLTQEL